MGGGLSFRTTEKELRDAFEIQHRIGVSSITIASDKDSGKSKGYAFVELTDAAQASRAVRLMHGSELGGRHMTVEIKGGDRGTRPGLMGAKPSVPTQRSAEEAMSKVFVGGLAPDVTDDKLKVAFGKVADVKSARVMFDPETGRAKGFGFVELVNQRDLEKVLKRMQGVDVCGKPIRVAMTGPAANTNKVPPKGLSTDRKRPMFGSGSSRSRSRNKRKKRKGSR